MAMRVGFVGSNMRSLFVTMWRSMLEDVEGTSHVPLRMASSVMERCCLRMRRERTTMAEETLRRRAIRGRRREYTKHTMVV
jgi:hypothetical protein